MTIHDDDTPGLRLTTHRVAALEGGEWVAYGLSLRSQPSGPVREIFIIHVGCTRCVTSSTDNIMKIRARITLTVEFIRTCIFLF
jgi:hypothetical protein